MKKLLNLLALSVALVSLLAGCASTSGGGKAAKSVVYRSAEQVSEAQGVAMTVSTAFTFNADGTFVYHLNFIGDYGNGYSMLEDFDGASGTYAGTPAKDGDITLTTTAQVDLEALTREAGAKFAEIVQGGGTTYTFTNADFPLRAAPAKSETLTVRDGAFAYEGIILRRQ